MEQKIHKNRIILVFIFFLILDGLLLSRLVYLQIAKSISLAKIADSQHKIIIELEPRRGTIYDRNMYKLAFNINANSVFAVPKDMDEWQKPFAAHRLSSILGVDRDFVLRRLQRKKGFVWLKRKITEQESDQIKALKLKGVELIRESKRLYPNGYLAAHIIGFAGLDNTGLEGMELLYDKYLKGRPGIRVTSRDAKRRFIPSEDEKLLTAVNGFNLILNIDETIQYIAEQNLDAAYHKYNARGGIIIVMNPHTGEILALANRPTYDPGFFYLAQPEERRNRCVADSFEPGSVFKIVTASCALEKGVVAFQDKFFCENGKYWIAGHVLHDHEPYGTLTFKEVIEKSSNIGTVKVAQKLAPRDLYNYVKGFGFGQLTGIDLKGEVGGKTYPPEKWSKATISALPIGQEVTVTAIQLASAMSAIANGGNLMKPWIVREIIDEKGEVIASFEPTVIRRVLSEDTTRKMKEILQGVIETGTATLGKLETYTAGGKTGTAQKIDPAGGYSHSKFVGSFVGFAPVNDPKIVVAVCLDEPHPQYYGGTVSAPVFKKVAEDTLRYMGVQSDLARRDASKGFSGVSKD